jgi:hypothetical protein
VSPLANKHAPRWLPLAAPVHGRGTGQGTGQTTSSPRPLLPYPSCVSCVLSYFSLCVCADLFVRSVCVEETAAQRQQRGNGPRRLAPHHGGTAAQRDWRTGRGGQTHTHTHTPLYHDATPHHIPQGIAQRSATPGQSAPPPSPPCCCRLCPPAKSEILPACLTDRPTYTITDRWSRTED